MSRIEQALLKEKGEAIAALEAEVERLRTIIPTCTRGPKACDALIAELEGKLSVAERAASAFDDDNTALHLEREALRRVAHEAAGMLLGGDDGPAERCHECGTGGVGYLREALNALPDAVRPERRRRGTQVIDLGKALKKSLETKP